MKVTADIEECKKVNDYFPSIFTNKDNTIVILADARTSQNTFSGMILSSHNNSKGCTVGTYGTSWTYTQFHRLPKNSIIKLEIEQND